MKTAHMDKHGYRSLVTKAITAEVDDNPSISYEFSALFNPTLETERTEK